MFFKFTTAGESHGKALVTIIEGLPAGLSVSIERIDRELWRRQQGYGRGGRVSPIVTQPMRTASSGVTSEIIIALVDSIRLRSQ